VLMNWLVRTFLKSVLTSNEFILTLNENIVLSSMLKRNEVAVTYLKTHNLGVLKKWYKILLDILCPEKTITSYLYSGFKYRMAFFSANLDFE